MATRTQKIRLGVFMLLAFLMLFGTVGTLAGLKLWNPRDMYFVRYRESVSGLDVGSAVKMKGVRVGRVERVKVTAGAEEVEVRLALDPKTPVTVDTRAVVAAIGITGLKFIELTGGTAKSEKLKPNTDKSEIKAGASVMKTLTGKATSIAHKTEGVLNNALALTNEEMRNKVRALLDNANALVETWTEIGKRNKRRVARITRNLDRMSGALDTAAKNLGKLVREVSPAVRATLAATQGAANSVRRAVKNLRPQATLAEIQGAARALRKRIEDPGITKALKALQGSAKLVAGLAKQISSMVRRSDRQLGRLLSRLNGAASALKKFSEAVRERPSLLLRGRTRTERKVR